MFNPLTFNIALRYMGAKRQNHFISFISLISMLGLMLGVAVLILVLSVMNGFGRELERRVLGMVPHAVLNGYAPFSEWQEIKEILEADLEVEAAAPLTELQGMLSYGGLVTGLYVSGVDPIAEQQVSIVGDFLTVGELSNLKAGEFGLVVGATLASRLGVGLGDKVTFVLPEATVTPAGVIPRFKRFEVVGVFKVGAEIDGLMAYIHWQDAAKLLRQPGQISGMRLRFNDLFQAPKMVRDWARDERLSGFNGFYPSDWTQTHGTLFQAIKMEKTMIALLLTLIMAVASFNIVSSLMMLVHEKTGDIAILRTLGSSPYFIRKVFLWQGLIIGVLGTTLGAVLGTVLALTVSDLVAWIERFFSTELFNAYFINYLPSELRLFDVVLIVSTALILSFLATLYPAHRAAMVPPAQALRYEN